MSDTKQPWLRWYTDVLHNPKVHRLGKPEYWTWSMMLAAFRQNGDVMPTLADLAFLLRTPAKTIARHIKTITDVGLFDFEEGDIRPHNWDDLQFISDSSRQRTAEYRLRKQREAVTSNDDVTSHGSHEERHGDADVTAQERARSDAEQSRAEQMQMQMQSRTRGAPLALSLPDWLPPEAWRDFVEHRKAMKAPLRKRGAELIIAELGEFVAKGHDPTQVLNTSIKRGWRGVFEPKPETYANGSPHKTKLDLITERNRETFARVIAKLEPQA